MLFSWTNDRMYSFQDDILCSFFHEGIKIKKLHNNFPFHVCSKTTFQQIDLLHVNAIKSTEPNFIAH